MVYWSEEGGVAHVRAFASDQLVEALQFCESCRRQGRRHVCISSELDESIGEVGVDAVTEGRLPGGQPYDFSKAHRGAGPQRKSSG